MSLSLQFKLITITRQKDTAVEDSAIIYEIVRHL